MLSSFKDYVLHCLHLDFERQAEEEVELKNRELSRHIVKRFSRGSIGLQSGRFITQDDIDAQKRALRKQIAKS